MSYVSSTQRRWSSRLAATLTPLCQSAFFTFSKQGVPLTQGQIGRRQWEEKRPTLQTNSLVPFPEGAWHCSNLRRLALGGPLSLPRLIRFTSRSAWPRSGRLNHGTTVMDGRRCFCWKGKRVIVIGWRGGTGIETWEKCGRLLGNRHVQVRSDLYKLKIQINKCRYNAVTVS